MKTVTLRSLGLLGQPSFGGGLASGIQPATQHTTIQPFVSGNTHGYTCIDNGAFTVTLVMIIATLVVSVVTLIVTG